VTVAATAERFASSRPGRRRTQISGFNILDCADPRRGGRGRGEASRRLVRHAGAPGVRRLV